MRERFVPLPTTPFNHSAHAALIRAGLNTEAMESRPRLRSIVMPSAFLHLATKGSLAEGHELGDPGALCSALGDGPLGRLDFADGVAFRSVPCEEVICASAADAQNDMCCGQLRQDAQSGKDFRIWPKPVIYGRTSWCSFAPPSRTFATVVGNPQKRLLDLIAKFFVGKEG